MPGPERLSGESQGCFLCFHMENTRPSSPAQGHTDVRCSINVVGSPWLPPSQRAPGHPRPPCFLGRGRCHHGPGGGSPLHSRVEEVQEGRAVLAAIEAHAEVAEVVLSQGGFNDLQGACHLPPQRRACKWTDRKIRPRGSEGQWGPAALAGSLSRLPRVPRLKATGYSPF